jgi:thiol-disulfide isomerase/thioredoxin
MNKESLQMSRVNVQISLKDVVKSKNRVFVLLYASWCPFSQRFLPIFEKFAQDKTRTCVSIVVDDKVSLRRELSIEVVPTVLFFENGKLSKRLDGVTGEGLTQRQLIDFSKKC